MTISDARVMGAAAACEILGYASSPSGAYILAGDKAKTRSRKRWGTIAVIRRFARPCMVWGSECVSKVSNDLELVEAAKASRRHEKSSQQRKDSMVGNCIPGLEIDASLALQDGETVFVEIADNFPSIVDYPTVDHVADFRETINLLLCGLPDDELELVSQSLLNSITRLGHPKHEKVS
ncbi:hypothetical protein K431DRAFT_313673 [Polychaeton citri CBS 116435]|uniref:Uncharacterized protein n=1 Tax=Polychaeton citri CBS 116435 TaxID=1314669 RepID=A0A9P4Q8K4_9PEZI|nr:hypothetical protein K431DRAFT_313673 [Polychaeton citri CBS 116435]